MPEGDRPPAGRLKTFCSPHLRAKDGDAGRTARKGYGLDGLGRSPAFKRNKASRKADEFLLCMRDGSSPDGEDAPRLRAHCA